MLGGVFEREDGRWYGMVWDGMIVSRDGFVGLFARSGDRTK
jgi:hypothetical protein